MLHKVDSRGWESNTAWCVPTAISIITGIPLIHSHSRAAFMKNTKLTEVEGVEHGITISMLYEQGYKTSIVNLVERFPGKKHLKLSEFLENRTAYEQCMPMLLSVYKPRTKSTHLIACEYNFVADNNHGFKPVNYSQHCYSDANIYHAMIVEQMQ